MSDTRKRPSEDDTGKLKDPVEVKQHKSQPPHKKPHHSRVTVEDIQLARETAELFQSNIFKLEVDELVHELKLKDSHCKLMEKVLHRLYDIIQKIPDSKPLSLDESKRFFANSDAEVSIPFPDPKPAAVNYKFQYKKPADVSLVGSFGLRTGIKQPAPHGMVVDVALTMPESLLQKKDYMNYRAFYKRSFYLAYLVEKLDLLCSKNGLPVKFSYEYADGDVLCPTIRLESTRPSSHKDDKVLGFQNTGFAIKLFVAFPSKAFESRKLLPDRNCIRVKAPGTSPESLPPTPLYNSSLLSSCSYTIFLKYLYSAKKCAEAFRDACVLGKLWLRQRGFDSSFHHGGFGHFEFAVLMAALLDGGGSNGSRILLHGFSSYQLFKATLNYLASQNLCYNGYLSFYSEPDKHHSVLKPEGFGIPTIFDKNTKLNVLWKMTASSYNMLRHYAASTSELLNDVTEDRFRETFILRSNNHLLKYDTLIQIPISCLSSQLETFGPLEKISSLTFDRYICSRIYKILSLALEGRATQISVTASTRPERWEVTRRRPASSGNNGIISIGLLLDPSESEKRITKGPLHSQQEEGQQFTAFWGPKAQIRRYKNGNIQYSCLWPASAKDTPTVTIAKYILDLHLCEGISSKMVVNSSKFNMLLPQPITPVQHDSHPLIMPSHFALLRNSYDTLCRLIYHADKLPLTVKSVLAASPSLRGTSLLLPVPFAVTNPNFFNDCIIQFETSTRWPDEILALEQTKTAFLLKLRSYISRHSGYTAYLTRDNTIPYMPKDAMTTLNVLTPDGYGFRMRVLTERDEALYLRAIENAEPRKRKAVTDSYVAFMRRYITCVKHHRAISSLVTRFPFYGPTVRLFKQWLDSQLLLAFFPEELVELIAVKAFIDPAPYADAPSSVATGFLRILSFISHWNWREEPLILDLSKSLEDKTDVDDNELEETKIAGLHTGKLSVEEHHRMYESFKLLRKEDPSGSKVQMFVACREDPSGKLWSQNSTGIPIVSRLTALSKAVIGLLSRTDNFSDSVLELVFTPAVKDFDFVIEVEAPFDLRPRSGVMSSRKFRNLVQPPSEYPDSDGTGAEWSDPVENYFNDLRARFNNVCILSSHLCTALGKKGKRNVITGLFHPSILHSKKKFRVNVGYSVKPSDEDNHVECNKDDIVSQMVALGGDLVVSFKQYH